MRREGRLGRARLNDYPGDTLNHRLKRLDVAGYILILTILQGVPFAPAAAQVRGVVLDEAGSPFGGVMVELWETGARGATAFTNGDGRFHFSEGQVGSAKALTLSHIGYQPLSASLGPTDTAITYSMVIRPIELPGLQAVAITGACPNQEDPGAREAWATARRT